MWIRLCQPEASFGGDGQDQLAQLLRLALAALGVRRLGLAVLLLADPVCERTRADDRHHGQRGLKPKSELERVVQFQPIQHFAPLANSRRF